MPSPLRGEVSDNPSLIGHEGGRFPKGSTALLAVRMLRVPALLALSALLVLPARGQDTDIQRAMQRVERFQLFNACRPMLLGVEDLHEDAAAVGLTREALQAAAESRLRAARLYTEDRGTADGAHLYVNVSVAGLAFSTSVQIRKVVFDRHGQLGTASTWIDGSVGQHGGSGVSLILSSLSQILDRFLAAYMRVNEEACDSPAPRP